MTARPPLTTDVRRFEVWLGAQRVGLLSARDDYTWFVMDEAYIDDPRRAVLGLRFEQDLRARHSANLRLPPWFSNLLPEGRVREMVARARGVSIDREMELLAQLGQDLPGAVRVLPAAGPAATPVYSREIVANHSAEERSAAWRFSLAGVQVKFSMLAAADRFTAPAVGEQGDWIVKLPDPQFARVPRNEFAMMELARQAGLDVPETRLVHRDAIVGLPESVWPNGEEEAYAVKRFDRMVDGGRTHMEDLAQVRGFYPADKYAGSYETLGALIYRRRHADSYAEFIRRLCFIVLIRNGDAHLKNWSLLYRNPRVPELSPAYDLVATSVYRPPSDPETLALKLSGTRRFERVTLSSFKQLHARIGASEVSVEHEVADVIQRTLATWPSVEPIIGDAKLASAVSAVIREGAARLRAQ